MRNLTTYLVLRNIKRGVSEILPVYLTLKLDEFRVLVTSFKNPMRINNFWKYMTHIHHSKYNIESYFDHIDISLKRRDPKLQCLKAFGSDEKENIVKVFPAEPPKVVNIKRFHHFRGSAEHRLEMK